MRGELLYFKLKLVTENWKQNLPLTCPKKRAWPAIFPETKTQDTKLKTNEKLPQA